MWIDSSGEIISHALAKLGMRVTSDREYPSLIKGWQSNFNINFSTERLYGLTANYQVGVWLWKEGLLHCLDNIQSGGFIIHNFERRKLGVPDLLEQAKQKDITIVYIPTREICHQHKIWYLFENTLVIGAIAKCYGIPYATIEEALHKRYGKKESVREMNKKCLQEGYELIEKPLVSLEVSSPLEQQERVLIDGNTALALWAIHAGVRTYFAYPMSPSSSILDYMAATALETWIVVKQAEDEITAIQMNIGASYAGTRALTSTSGGWFDLMSESISLSGMIEVPCVVVVAQRPWPATGLPTWTAQADLNLALYAGHGEFARLVVAVSDQESAFELMQHAFNYAELYQLPCIVLTEKAIAENHATVPKFMFNTIPVERWVVTAEWDLDKLQSKERYMVSESWVSKRWLPTSTATTYFCNGDEHGEDGSLDESPEVAQMISKRLRKLDALAQALPDPSLYGKADASIWVIGRWSTKMPMLDAIALLQAEGIDISYMHIEWLRPLKTSALLAFMASKSKIIVVESNATWQLADLIQQQTWVTIDKRVLKWNGRSLFVEDVVEWIKKR